jgi:hypothetical protein
LVYEPDEVYIEIVGSTKPLHWLPHLVPDSLLLQEISYQTYVNGVVASLYQVLFDDEAPCLSPEGKKIVEEYGDWYMTPYKLYIGIVGSTKPPHWLPHIVPDSLLLQEISYQTYVNGVATSLH